MALIAVGGIMHESNTFSPTPTDLSLFRVQRGQEIIARWGAARHEMSGFIAGAEEFSLTLYPTLMAGAIPAGTVSAEAFDTLMDELLDRLKNAPPLDG
ncbi:MAG: M81 family metallopeptidase, partial [Burkholderiales bacterium]|nr:M81 family metallopeptidase [Anaerolineae bacterium]